MMRVTVSNEITVENPSEELRQWCKKNLVIRNPVYEKKFRMKLWLGNTPEKLWLYKVDGDSLILPFGMLDSIIPLLQDAEIQTDFPKPRRVDYKCEVSLFDYQQPAVDALVKAKHGILESKAGSGKGLPLSAKIYTPNGFKRNGDLQIGDEICNTYGGVSKVTGIFDRGKQSCYKVTFTDDTEIVCDSSHLWSVRNVRHKGAGWETVSVAELYQRGIHDACGNRLYEIPITAPVAFAEQEVSIDPWVLGVLLGDGYFSECGIALSNTEPDIIDKFRVRTQASLHQSTSRPQNWTIGDGGKLCYRLKDYGLACKRSWEKFIPKEYIYNSVTVRLAVIQGLMDTDGSVSGTTYSITSTSKQLVDDFLTIVESLGGTGKIAVRNTHFTYKGETKAGRTSYRLHFKLYNFIPFTSLKHLAKYKPRSKYTSAYRRIKQISLSAPQTTRCISVDSRDSLYLTNHFVATHNTQMGIALIGRLGVKTLWLTHTKELLEQSMERAGRYMDASLFGTITDGKVNIGKGITFATVQTLAKQDMTQYRNTWDCVVVDECHRCAGSPTSLNQFAMVLNNLACPHKYGLSATVHRADGLTKTIFCFLGNIAYSVPDSAVADKVMAVEVRRRNTGVQIAQQCLDTDGTLIFQNMVSYLAQSNRRNYSIVNDLVANADHYNLILSERLMHLDTLMDMLPDELRKQSVMIDGKMTSKAAKVFRKQAIDEMRGGKKHFLFASYRLAKEGLDIPRLDRLYLVTPQKDYTTIVQSVGRIARTFPEKDTPVCYDYVDDIDYLVRTFKTRCRHYRKCGCAIKEDE